MSKRARKQHERAPKKCARVEKECATAPSWSAAGFEDMLGAHMIRPLLLTQDRVMQETLWELTRVNKGFRSAFFAALTFFDEYLFQLKRALEAWKLPAPFTWPWPNGYTTGTKPESKYRDNFPSTVHRTFLMAWLHARFAGPCSEPVRVAITEKLDRVNCEWPPYILLEKKNRELGRCEARLGSMRDHRLPYTICRLPQISMRCAANSLQAMAATLDPVTEIPILLMFMSLTSLQSMLTDWTARVEMISAFMQWYWLVKAGPQTTREEYGDFAHVLHEEKWTRSIDLFDLLFDQRKAVAHVK